jgi:hypothetical protein
MPAPYCSTIETGGVALNSSTGVQIAKVTPFRVVQVTVECTAAFKYSSALAGTYVDALLQYGYGDDGTSSLATFSFPVTDGDAKIWFKSASGTPTLTYTLFAASPTATFD